MDSSSDDDDNLYSSARFVAGFAKELKDRSQDDRDDKEDAKNPEPGTVYNTRCKKSSTSGVNQDNLPCATIDLDSTLDLSHDSDGEEEFEEMVSVIWCGDFTNVHRFSLKRKDLLRPVFAHYAELHRVDPSKISVKLKMRDVTQYDSLDTLGFRVTDFLEASIRGEKDDVGLMYADDVFDEKEKLEFKCRMRNAKKPLFFKLHPKQPMHFLYQMCSKQLKCPIASISLHFDGEVVKQSDTVESLGLEGDECFDLYVKQ